MNKADDRIRKGGWIFLPVKARKTFTCAACGNELVGEYYQCEKGGGGFRYRIHPYRIHKDEIDMFLEDRK